MRSWESVSVLAQVWMAVEQAFEQLFDHAKGQAPEHGPSFPQQVDGGYGPAALVPADAGLQVALRVDEFSDGEPEDFPDLVVEGERAGVGEVVNEAGNLYGEYGTGDIVQAAEKFRFGQIEADLFPRLPLGGVAQVGVTRIEAPAGKGDIARPGVALMPGPFDEKNFEAFPALPKNEGDGGLGFLPGGAEFRLIRSQSVSNVIDGNHDERNLCDFLLV